MSLETEEQAQAFPLDETVDSYICYLETCTVQGVIVQIEVKKRQQRLNLGSKQIKQYLLNYNLITRRYIPDDSE